jgi:hypothetical protein
VLHVVLKLPPLAGQAHRDAAAVDRAVELVDETDRLGPVEDARRARTGNTERPPNVEDPHRPLVDELHDESRQAEINLSFSESALDRCLPRRRAQQHLRLVDTRESRRDGKSPHGRLWDVVAALCASRRGTNRLEIEPRFHTSILAPG